MAGSRIRKVILYGAGEMGQRLLRRISSAKDKIEIAGFADSFKTGGCCGYQILEMQELKGIEADIIITVENSGIMREIYDHLNRFNVGRIYWHYDNGDSTAIDTYEAFLQKECIYLSDIVMEKGILSQVEMHISDYCNLNCAGCAHFSPIFEKKLPDVQRRIADVRKLSEKVGLILRFFIMGGEPLLNPEITKYIEDIKIILPDTDIWIVTNGLLIPTISEEVLTCIRENDIGVSVSEYEPTRHVMDRIITRMQNAGLRYSIRPYNSKQKFIKPLTLSEHSKYKNRCISQNCVNICDGMIARCPTLMYINKFNETFGTHLPDDGIYDLENCPAGGELCALLQKEVPLCRHCIENEMEWSRCGSKVALTDFAVED